MSKEDNTKHSNQDEKLSICEIMKEDTSEIIKKMESTMPSLIQNYSKLYGEYLHMIDDIFGTCYIAEKEFLDKLNINEAIIKQIKENSEIFRNNYIENIDIASKSFDYYVEMRISAIRSFDNYVHAMMDSYTNMITQFNKSIKQ